jgi:hypothetical protein
VSVVRDYWGLVGHVAVVSEGVGGDGGLYVGVEAGVASGGSNVGWLSSFEGNGQDGGAGGGGEELFGREVSIVGIDLPTDWSVLVVEGRWRVGQLGGG